MTLSPAIDGTVYVIEDEARVRIALEELFGAYGVSVVGFDSARAYLDHPRDAPVACVLLDLGLPDIDGLELQQQLVDADGPPIIVLTGRGDIPQTVRAMKAGALEFLTKPVEPDKLLAAVRAGLDHDRSARQRRLERSEVQQRFARLTPRERQVLELVVGGMRNKQAAAALGISEVTLQVHRGQIMRKTAARSFAELVRMTVTAGADRAESGPRAETVVGSPSPGATRPSTPSS